MHPFIAAGERRPHPPEVRAYIAKTMGTCAVDGFQRLLSCGGFTGGKRATPFLETADTSEWFLPLSADSPMVWQTAVLPSASEGKTAFLFGVGFGNGSPLPQPTGYWDIEVNGRRAVSVRVVKHSQLWSTEECSFAFSAHRSEAAPHGGSLYLSSVLTNEAFATFGPAMLTVPTEWLETGKPMN